MLKISDYTKAKINLYKYLRYFSCSMCVFCLGNSKQNTHMLQLDIY